jgi:hypothetical protein
MESGVVCVAVSNASMRPKPIVPAYAVAVPSSCDAVAMTCAVVVLPFVPVTPIVRTVCDGEPKKRSAIVPRIAVRFGTASSSTLSGTRGAATPGVGSHRIALAPAFTA